MQEILLRITYFERGLSKTLFNFTLFYLTLFFLSNPVTFNRQSYKKQKGLGTSDQSFFRLWNKFKKISLLVIYYQTKFDGVIKSGSSVTPKLIPANLCKPIHDIINYSTYICSFEFGKCGKDEEKLQKFEYPENEKSFLDEIKNIFHSFWRAIIWWKNKNLIKNSGQKLLKMSKCPMEEG